MNDENKGRGRRNRIPKTIDLEASEVTRVEKQEDASASEGAMDEAVAGNGKAAEEVRAESPDEEAGAGRSDSPGAADDASGPDGETPEAATHRDDESAQPEPSYPRQADPAQETADTAPARVVPFVLAGLAGGILALALAGVLVFTGVLGPASGGSSAPSTAALDGMEAKFTALQDRFSQLEAAPKPAPGGASSSDLDALAARVSSAEEAIAALKQAETAAPSEPDGRLDAVSARLDAAESDISSLRDALNESKQADPRAVSELAGKVEMLAGDVTQVEQSTQAAASRIDAAEAGLADVTQKVAAFSEARARADSQGRALARSVAANAIRTAYDRGASFAGLLASARTLSDADAAIATLEPLATLGVATNARLLADFQSIASQTISASQTKEDGVVAQLFSNARSLVQVRPVGAQAGGTPEAIVSRIEADLKSGDMAQALAEWRSLPEASRAASADFGQALETRVTADKAMAELLDSLARNGEQG